MSNLIINLNAEEAQEAVRQANLSMQEKADFFTFIHNFPDAPFFANTKEALEDYQHQQRIRLPKWFLTYRETLAEAYAGADNLAVQFAGFSRQKDTCLPRLKPLKDLWYTLSLPGLPKGKRERDAYLKGSPTVKLFPIATQIIDDRHQLGINLSEIDTQIYEYHTEDIEAAYFAQEDIATCIYPAFKSPAQMLSQIQAIQHGNQITQAKIPHQTAGDIQGNIEKGPTT